MAEPVQHADAMAMEGAGEIYSSFFHKYLYHTIKWMPLPTTRIGSDRIWSSECVQCVRVYLCVWVCVSRAVDGTGTDSGDIDESPCEDK